MKERPIPFSAPMVQGILEGRKTNTRRVLDTQPLDVLPMNVPNQWVAHIGNDPLPHGQVFRCRYGIPGDRLWVREAWGTETRWNDTPPRDIRQTAPLWYAADGFAPEWAGKRRPPMFMPRWASRITLELTSVRVERLQDITDADALAEGVDRTNASIPGYARTRFTNLWNTINATRGYGWDANPWVWVLAFTQVRPCPPANVRR